jgi:transposase
MDVLIARCCGLDVHLATVMACLLLTDSMGRARAVKREFSTMTDGLAELVAWLKSEGITHVAMESTGVYWMPVYSALEGAIDITVANAQHVKKVPGRKTDMSDAEWLGRLLRCGLLSKSFIPPAEFRAIRDLTRSRRSLVQDRTREVNRLHKVLVTANVKLSAVISDVFGVSGVQMVRALVEGVKTPREIAALALGSMRKKMPEIARAVDCTMLAHHRTLLRLKLEHIDMIEGQIKALDADIAARFKPYEAQLTLLDTIPGVDRKVAEQILSEIGVDIALYFASANKLAAWSGVAPGNNQSAGKDLGGKRRRGNIFMTTILVEAALAASKKKESYLRDKYHRLKARRGAKRAALAIAHKIILAVYRVLTTGVLYEDLGAAYLDKRDKDKTILNLLGRLKRLGVEIPALAPGTNGHDISVETAETDSKVA